MNKIIYLSPHLDDAVLSCGGIIWHQVQHHDEVEIWTLFAGDPPQKELSPFAQAIHQRWQTREPAAAVRRAEDTLACERLQITPRQFAYPDCIYRNSPDTDQPLIKENEDLFQPLPACEQPFVDEITAALRPILPQEAILVIPLAVGNHIDHQIVRLAGEKLTHPLFYYADFPYSGSHPEDVQKQVPQNSSSYHFPINNQALALWQYAVEAYTSQISTFWPSLSDMYKNVENYAKSPLGNCLWQSDKK